MHMLTMATALISALAGGMGHADVPRLTFRADFDGSIEAQVGAGAAEATGAPGFAAGRHGQAYVADGKSVLSFPAADNLDKAQGTVAMWVSPLWDGADGQNHSFFSDDIDFNKPADNNIHLWKWVSNDVLRFDIRTDPPKDIESSVAGWKAGEWHQRRRGSGAHEPVSRREAGGDAQGSRHPCRPHRRGHRHRA